MTDDSATLRAMAERLSVGPTVVSRNESAAVAQAYLALLVSQSSWAKEKAELERQLAEYRDPDWTKNPRTARSDKNMEDGWALGGRAETAEAALRFYVQSEDEGLEDADLDKFSEMARAALSSETHASRPVTVKD